jgi:pyruvate/2-oxoglutarate dehydrogenase complex dihydrolipoamide dehydrogenase (E3) component
VNYRSVPWAIFSAPQLARVGLTEAQAKRNYGNTVVVLRQYFKSVAAAQLSGETTGICKLILLENGVILGAAVVGTQAVEVINVVALAIAQNLKVDALIDLVPIYPSLSEILDQLAVAWKRQRIHRNIKLRNFLESFFNFGVLGHASY